MNNIEFVRKTPFGDIVIIPTGEDDEYPGVVIEVDGDVVARVEFDTLDKGLSVMAWYKGNEDYSTKLVSNLGTKNILPVSEQDDQSLSLLDDIYCAINSVEGLDSVDSSLTNEQILSILEKLKKYDYQDYNDYVVDLVRDELKKNN